MGKTGFEKSNRAGIRRDLTRWRAQIPDVKLGAAASLLLAERPHLGPRDLDVPPGKNRVRSSERSDALLDSLVLRQKLIARLQAEQQADLVELSRSYVGLREFLPTELAVALSVSDPAASGRVHRAEEMTDDLDRTLRTQLAGELTADKAEIIRRGTAGLSQRLRRLVEADVLPTAAQLLPTRLETRSAGRFYGRTRKAPRTVGSGPSVNGMCGASRCRTRWPPSPSRPTRWHLHP